MIDQFKAAVEKSDPAALRALLADHADVRAVIDLAIFDADQPAVVACRDDRAMVDVLLEFGADINARSQFWGRTIGVLDDNSPEMRAYLIARGALPEIGAFADAVDAKDAAAVRRLLTDVPALRQHVNRPISHFGQQAIVAAKDHRAMVETLLEFGADINVKSDWAPGGFGVLDNTDPEQAGWLIARGAIVDIHAAAGLGMIEKVREWLAVDPALVHARGGDGQLPLHFAKTTEIADLLLDHGADINARDVDHTATAAQWQVQNQALCRHLIARGAEVDIFMAAALGDRALVERVLSADPASITAQIGKPGYAPVPPGHIYQWKLGGPSVLRVAAAHGGQDVFELLYSRSPAKEQLFDACRRADEAAARRVLAAHPDLMSQLSPEEHALLDEAAFDKKLAALDLMLTLGFDVNVRGAEGFTPVNHAALRGAVAIVRRLIAHGADVESRNQYGGTALESCQWGSLNFRDPAGDYPACVDVLLQAGAKVAHPSVGSEAVQAVLRRHAKS